MYSKPSLLRGIFVSSAVVKQNFNATVIKTKKENNFTQKKPFKHAGECIMVLRVCGAGIVVYGQREVILLVNVPQSVLS